MDQDWEDAIRDGDPGRVRRWLDSGAAIDAPDRHGQTALMVAARHGRREIVDLLIARGARLDVTAKFGLSALMLAVINRHAPVAEALLKAGADVTIRGTGAPGFHGRTAADLADESGQPEVARRIRTAT